MSLLTKVCIGVGKWIVVEDEGFMRQIRGVELRPASSRFGTMVLGPVEEPDADRYICNRNNLEYRTPAPLEAAEGSK